MTYQRDIPEKLLSLQCLRAVAALGVVFYHAEMGANIYQSGTPEVKAFGLGGVGVLLFFVLSGFVIAMASARRPRTAGEFLVGRMARLYPPYLATAALFIALLALVPRGALNHEPDISLARLARTLVFDLGQMGGYVYVSWTMFYEFCFYLLFAIVAQRFQGLHQEVWFKVALAVSLLICAVSGWVLVGCFLLGIIVFDFFEACSLIRWRPGWIYGFMGLSIISFGYRSSPALACAFLLAILVLLERFALLRFDFDAVVRIGDASYSIYLAQVITISVALKLAKALSGSSTAFVPLAITLAVIGTVVGGIAMYRWIERPSTTLTLRLGKRLLNGGAAHKG
jgi:exopolysaccharide production protein ExoZ